MDWQKIKERLKSPVVWVAVFTQICMIVSLFNEELSQTIKVISTCIIEIFTLFAVLNNPSDRNNF